ncbi:MAG: SAM-dependent methyltransferase [Tannerella sp.]|jgi:predicted O-methyltransferase YrrM|nr:SAM-dependent methyltransferase [Tannerella sp.]
MQLYRKLFHRKGHGIHSPFVFDLVTNVIEQPYPYYGYRDIDLIRLHLRLHDQAITWQDKQSSIKKYLRNQAISQKEGELLFRLANHYKPYDILTIGSSMGLAPLYLTGYSSHLHCISLESETDIATIARRNIEKKTNSPIRLIQADYLTALQETLQQFKRIDCLYLSKELTIKTINAAYHQCLPFIHDETLLIVSGIHSSSEKRNFWTQLCNDPKITVSVDLYKLGLIFFRPKLHKRMYKCCMI